MSRHASSSLPVGSLARILPAMVALALVAAGCAAKTGPEADRALLVKRGYATDARGFQHAITEGDVDSVRVFLRTGMSPDVKLDDIPVIHGPVFWGCVEGSRKEQGDHLGVLRTLIEAGADVNARDAQQFTPLMNAAFRSCPVAMFETLVAAGADPTLREGSGLTALDLAKRRDVKENVRFLEQATKDAARKR